MSQGSLQQAKEAHPVFFCAPPCRPSASIARGWTVSDATRAQIDERSQLRLTAARARIVDKDALLRGRELLQKRFECPLRHVCGDTDTRAIDESHALPRQCPQQARVVDEHRSRRVDSDRLSLALKLPPI